MSCRWLIIGLVLAAAPTSELRAQRVFAELPDSVALRLIAFYNAPGTTRLSGETLIAEGSELAAAVAVLGGPVTIAGSIEGSLVVINGDLRVTSTGRVAGSVTIVGGGFSGDPAAFANGFTHYREPLHFRHEADQLVYEESFAPELTAGTEFGFGRTDVQLAVRGSYNRVEGLPISIGPRVMLGRSNPTVLEGLVIYRSSAGLRVDPDQLGYVVGVEQFLGGGRTARIGVRVSSEFQPIESGGLADRENSLSTFVLHEDRRDAYEREGWSVYARFARPGWPHDITVEYRDERHRAAVPASPWSLFDNEDPWRFQPLIAEGTLRTLSTRVGYDTRNDEREPTTGWHVQAELEQGLGGRLVQPLGLELGNGDDDPLAPRDARERFTSARFDIRRYVRLAPTAWATIRAFGAGSVDGASLPPQRQHTLGGEGTLPGYTLNRFDCGARTATVEYNDETFVPFYGCDRAMLFQFEYQAEFPIQPSFRNGLRDFGLDQTLRWVLFFDMGRAWNLRGARNGRLGGLGEYSFDAGFGVRLGGIGFYWAVPLSEGGSGMNFFVRLGRRL